MTEVEALNLLIKMRVDLKTMMRDKDDSIFKKDIEALTVAIEFLSKRLRD